jgi:hypothetical protein
MRPLEEIMKDAEAKAQHLADKASEQPVVDEVLQKVIDGFLKKPKTRAKAKKSYSTTKPTKLKKLRKPPTRLTFEKILETYEKTGLKPFKAEYWFFEDRKCRPLVQVSTLSEDRTQATPLSAYALMKRKELLASDNPPTFITNYRDLDRPSNTWSMGRISQISGLDMSYILGFRSGYDGNKPGHSSCSSLYHLGYDDGLSVRNNMIEKSMIEPDPEEDIYADETDDGVLNELCRVRGYQREWDN